MAVYSVTTEMTVNTELRDALLHPHHDAPRVILVGGSGQIGTLLSRHFLSTRRQPLVLARNLQRQHPNTIQWDGRQLGSWVQELEGADAVINLAGRSVDCRYTTRNRREMMDSRVASTTLIGEAIRSLKNPPRVWLNASTATIYRHALDRPMDERSGEIGGSEADAPKTWRFSIDVAKRWEQAFFDSDTPQTRKVALRSAMTMSPDRGGVFDALLRLVRMGFGGAIGSGRQFVSWIHEADFARAVDFLLANERIHGAVNVAAPHPVPFDAFMRELRAAYGRKLAIGTPRWMLEIGAFFLRTESELVLKSRRVVPGQLLEAGFHFRFPEWSAAATDLVERWKTS